ncbi:MAG: TetR/AcrR family transcriptional regulator [Actinobacteria bacterium]|nr:TetR/AcrR family transcriptional regulator [Actinomycetota bacterium]MBU1943000.1 TetR/AcrR family transcriptional regulator [Actinomycetota bacterium]MBU2687760.1 TetR/AcrR family transcriptional regulator [Actinomycetota bacterium]
MAVQVADKNEKAREKEERILDVAKKRFLHYGYRKTTVDEIAADAGIGKASIYLLFKNKEDILLQLIDSEARSLQRFLYGKIKDEPDPLRKLEMIFEEAMNYLEENPFLKRLLMRDPEIISPKLVEHILDVNDRYIDIVEVYVKQVMEGRDDLAFKPRVVAYTIYKLFESFSYYSTLGEEDEISTQEIGSFVSTLLHRGLAYEPCEAPRE